MTIPSLNTFLYKYFTSHDCQITHDHDGVLTIQLNEEMDRALMNRPFYWHYIKKIGKEGTPLSLTLITNPDKREEKGEWIHYGSPRLHQIFHQLIDGEKYTQLYEQVNTSVKTALQPWLVINMKISYIGRQKKDEILSIGLNLINGGMKYDMMTSLEKISLQLKPADYCFTLSPLITLSSGFRRMETIIQDHIDKQPTNWITDTLKRKDKEIEVLQHFYLDSNDEEKEQMDRELNEIRNRYTPIIHYTVINGGLFYLQNGAIQ